ncbi:MAG TPA: cobalt ECF transporter T component CbiQ [Desulfobacteraceae bacterium]|nr:cobalt ECF transporter T component CbiQ [Desulfobacteraceae bacterium]
MIDRSLEQGDSFIHRIDPRIRIVTALCLSMTAAQCTHPAVAAGFLSISVVLALIAKLKAGQVLIRLKPLLWFLLMMWLFLPLTFTEDIVYRYGWLTVSRAGVQLCTMISLKSIGILIIFTSLLATMPVATLGAGLHRLRVPDKLVFLLLMTYRYIAVIRQEYNRLIRAARFRGFRPGTNLHSYRTYAYLAGMLFVRASHRADRVFQAMRCRGFTGRFRSLDVYTADGIHIGFLVICGAAGISLLIAERLWLN